MNRDTAAIERQERAFAERVAEAWSAGSDAQPILEEARKETLNVRRVKVLAQTIAAPAMKVRADARREKVTQGFVDQLAAAFVAGDDPAPILVKVRDAGLDRRTIMRRAAVSATRRIEKPEPTENEPSTDGVVSSEPVKRRGRPRKNPLAVEPMI